MIARPEEMGGLLRTDATRAKAGENLDGRYLIRTADPKLS
jgi:hypothetical protein